MGILTLFQSIPIKRFTRGLVIQRAAFSDQKDIEFWGSFFTYILLWFHPQSWAKFHSCPQRLDFISRMITGAAGRPWPALSGAVKSEVCRSVKRRERRTSLRNDTNFSFYQAVMGESPGGECSHCYFTSWNEDDVSIQVTWERWRIRENTAQKRPI